MVIEDISELLVPVTGRKQFAVVLHNLLSPDECAALVRRAEQDGFDDALIAGPGGEQILQRDVRACGRCIVDDAELANDVYARILGALGTVQALERKITRAPWVTPRAASASTSGCVESNNPNDDGTLNKEDRDIVAVGLNERMRFLKYGAGHFFAPHRDLRFVRGPDAGERAGETSHVTVQIYLNDRFKGGCTRFICGGRHYDVKPRTGSALIFDHDMLHEGSEVTGGVKYSVRTDVMYAPIKEGRSGQDGSLSSSQSSATKRNGCSSE